MCVCFLVDFRRRAVQNFLIFFKFLTIVNEVVTVNAGAANLNEGGKKHTHTHASIEGGERSRALKTDCEAAELKKGRDRDDDEKRV